MPRLMMRSHVWATDLSRRPTKNEEDMLGIALIVLAIIFSAFFGTCEKAHAQDIALPSITGECAPELTANRRAQLANAGADGVWFHMSVARCMLDRLTALPLYAERVHLLEQRLDLSDRMIALVREEAGLATREADAARGALESAIRRAREAEEDRDRWSRSPILWVCVGVAGAILLEVTAVLLLHETK